MLWNPVRSTGSARAEPLETDMNLRRTAAAAALLALSGCLAPNETASDAAASGGSSGADSGPVGGAPVGGGNGGGGGAPMGGGLGGDEPPVGGATGGAGGNPSIDAAVPPPDGPLGPPGDRDDDGVPDETDNCPRDANNNQADRDDDAAGDVCDNCPDTTNADQVDGDGDGVGDACDLDDDDADGVPGRADNCPAVFNPDQRDTDNDGVGDACDNCVGTPNFSQLDDDGDGIGNACEIEGDDDGDGIPDADDNCPRLPSANRADTDNDGVGDPCDNCPLVPNFSQLDDDGDGRGNACDADEPAGDAGPSPGCPPDAQTCDPQDTALVRRCVDGVWVSTLCGAGELCDADRCTAATCANVARLEGERGCEFRFTESPNLIFGPPDGHVSIPFGVLVANPSNVGVEVHLRDADERDAALVSRVVVPANPSDLEGVAETLTSAIYDGAGAAVQDQIGSAHAARIPPGGFGRFILPHPNPAQDLTRSAIRRANWHLTSDQPVVVVQHSPVQSARYYSADASLVPPTALGGRRFRFLGLPSWPTGFGSVYPAHLSVVPLGAADVDVSPAGAAASVLADAAGRILTQGARRTFSLEPGDAATLSSPVAVPAPDRVPDISGSVISADGAIAVLSSHVCTRMPHGLSACDHVEEFLPPTDRWARRHTLVPAPFRVANDPDDMTYWRIIADADGTRITTTVALAALGANPSGTPGTPRCRDLADVPDAFTLDAGQMCEIATRTAFGIEASTPVFVLGALSGQEAIPADGGLNGLGDPSVFSPVADEHRTHEALLVVPPGFPRSTIQVVLPAGARLRHQGQLVNLAAAAGVPGTVDVTLELPVVSGSVQRLASDEPFGAVFFGYGPGMSTAFPLAVRWRAGR
jgi:hypothetical protein